MATQVVDSRTREHPLTSRVLCRLQRHLHRHPRPTPTIPRRIIRPRTLILRLHGLHSHVLPTKHQHARRHKRHRSIAMSRRRNPHRLQRLPLPIHPLPAPRHRLALILAILPPPLDRRIRRPPPPQLVPCQSLRRRHILLLLRHGLRRRRYPGPLLQNPRPTPRPAILQLCLLRAPNLRPRPLSAPPSSQIQRPHRTHGTVRHAMESRSPTTPPSSPDPAPPAQTPPTTRHDRQERQICRNEQLYHFESLARLARTPARRSTSVGNYNVAVIRWLVWLVCATQVGSLGL